MLPETLLESLEFIHQRDIVELLKRKDRPKGGVRWVIKNDVRPVDLYCYLGARFGQPNGIQNFLRKDDSDNLVHWEWFLKVGAGFITIQGLNFRTEIWISGVDGVQEGDKEEFVSRIKQDFSSHGKAMGEVRKALEHWVEFVNPYQRLRRAVDGLMEELTALNLDSERDRMPDIAEELARDNEAIRNRWNEKAALYSRAFGLAFGVRSMLPVMAEAFVNLMLYILMKPELRSDERLRENAVRQQIDIRIRSLSHNCLGFERHIDYTSEPCRRFHTLMNERNDLLHGNLVVDKLRFNELYFFGKVPVFIQYSSMWDRSMGVAHRAVGMESIKDELNVVDGLIEYLLSCLRDDIKEEIRGITNRFDLGFSLDDGRFGVLFANWLVDFVPGPDKVGATSSEPRDLAQPDSDKEGRADADPE